MDIIFNYKNEAKTIIIEDQDLCDSIQSEIQQMNIENQNQVWYPNIEIDNRVRKYIGEKIKEESYYTPGIHPCFMLIRLDSKPYHVIPDYYSEEDKNKIINEILKDYQ